MTSRPNTWSPFQSKEVKDICAHMSDQELKKTENRARMYGLWCALTFACPLAFIVTKPNVVVFIIGGILIGIHIVCIPFWLRSQKQFLCAADWAKGQGFDWRSLKLFSFRF
jgi:hypothetical protein